MNGSRLVQEQKSFLRKELLRKLARVTAEEKARRSREILKKLFGHPKFLEAQVLLTYVALPNEVETRPILEKAWERRKKVFVPRIDLDRKQMVMIEVSRGGELSPGSFGVPEPTFDSRRVGRPEDFELVIVPGLGFDRAGGRLGRGEGFFDRFLVDASKAYKIALAFECQIVEKIPREPGDVAVDEVLMG